MTAETTWRHTGVQCTTGECGRSVCADGPCMHGATCIADATNFTCLCTHEYSGTWVKCRPYQRRCEGKWWGEKETWQVAETACVVGASDKMMRHSKLMSETWTSTERQREREREMRDDTRSDVSSDVSVRLNSS